MDKQNLIEKIAEKAGLTQKDSKIALNAAIESITESLAAGESVRLLGFGTFEVKESSDRSGYNPRTHEKISIPGHNVVRFRPGAVLKNAVK